MLKTDFHSHLIPGVDDGSRGAVETVAMARGLVDLGVERIHLTPHQYRMGNEFDVAELRKHTDEVWRMLARGNIPLEPVRGAEYYYGERLVDAIAGGEELITFEHEGETCILIELPMRAPAVGVRRVGAALIRRGIRPVMAHPERTQSLAHEPARIDRWLDAGWCLQLNLLSLVGAHGNDARELSRDFLADGLYDFTGSDIHRPAELPTLREAHRIFLELTSETEVLS